MEDASTNTVPTPAHTLRRDERLRGRKAIEGLFASGRWGFVYPFRYIFSLVDVQPEGGAPVSVLFSVPKRLHKRAVKRNLLKRRSREAYRQNKGALPGSVPRGKTMLVALVYGVKQIEDYNVIEESIKKIVGRLAEHRGR